MGFAKKLFVVVVLLVGVAGYSIYNGGGKVPQAVTTFTTVTGSASLNLTQPKVNVTYVSAGNYVWSKATAGSNITTTPVSLGKGAVNIGLLLTLTSPSGGNKTIGFSSIIGPNGTRSHSMTLGPGEGVSALGVYVITVKLSLTVTSNSTALVQRSVVRSRTFVLTSLGGTGMGNFEGRVIISPLCPASSKSTDVCIPVDYTRNQLILSTAVANSTATRVPLRADGTFSADVAVSITYTVTMSGCVWIGCNATFPKIVSVSANQTTFLNIGIDTGIR